MHGAMRWQDWRETSPSPYLIQEKNRSHKRWSMLLGKISFPFSDNPMTFLWWYSLALVAGHYTEPQEARLMCGDFIRTSTVRNQEPTTSELLLLDSCPLLIPSLLSGFWKRIPWTRCSQALVIIRITWRALISIVLGSTPSFWFRSFGKVGCKNLNFYHIPRWYWCCWSGGHTLRTTGDG